MSRHIDKVHPGQNLVSKFCCEVCGKTFGAPESLSRHVNSQCGKDSSLSYQLSTGIVSTPMTKFCVTIFVPAMAEDLKQVYDIDQNCSKLDRNLFAVVLLSCSFGVAMGTSGKIRIILSQCFLPSELDAVAEQLSVMNHWTILRNSVSFFSSPDSLASICNDNARFFASPLASDFMFIIGHGDATRVRVKYSGKSSFLLPTHLATAISQCGARSVHLITCKPHLLAQAIIKQSSSLRLNSFLSICAYGAADVTTVLFEYGSPLEKHVDWSRMELDEPNDGSAYVPLSAGILSFLCYIAESSIEEPVVNVLEEIYVPTHKGQKVNLQKILFHVQPQDRTILIGSMFPHNNRLQGLLAHVGMARGKYEWMLRQLQSVEEGGFDYID